NNGELNPFQFALPEKKFHKHIIIDGKKICSVCKIHKELYEFSKEKRNPTGYSHICKDCDKKRHEKCKQSNINGVVGIGLQFREPTHKVIDDHKECTQCGNIKHISDFRHSKHMKNNGLRSDCITC